jgi:hypothetical protein
MQLSTFLAAACLAAGANAQAQKTTVEIDMTTPYSGELKCNFNSNSHPAGGKCYETTSGNLVGLLEHPCH